MSKKLFSLVSVLALASLASAAEVSWVGPSGGDWNVAANWGGGVGVPTSADLVRLSQAGGVNMTINLSNALEGIDAYADKLAMKSGNVTLIVKSGATMRNNGSVDMLQYGGSVHQLTIEYGALMESSYAPVSSLGIFKLGGQGAYATVDVYGELNIVNVAGPEGLSAELRIIMSGADPSGDGELIIHSTGTVRADDYSINSSSDNTGHIEIKRGGRLILLGDESVKVAADIGLGKISSTDGPVSYWVEGGYTYVVPEPATLLLLGLGGLMLRKRRV